MAQTMQSEDRERKDGIDVFKMFIGQIEQYEPVSKEEEKELLRKIHEGDESARTKLVMSNIRFVISIATKYNHLGLDQIDLVQEGYIGLNEAVDKFDEKYGVRFLSYATYWIRESILSALAKNGRTIQLPKEQISLIRKINRVIEDFKQKNGIEPTETEIAEILDIADMTVSNAIQSSRNNISFEAPYKNDDDEDNKFSPQDTIHATDTDPEKYVDDQSKVKELEKALLVLPPSEQFVIGHLSGIRYNKSSISEIATKLKQPEKKIQQIKEKGIRGIKSKLKGDIVQEFISRMKK